IYVNGTKFVTPIDKAHGGAFKQMVPLFCSSADNDDEPSNDQENNNVIEFLVTKDDGFSQYAGWQRLEIECDGNTPVARVTLTWDNGPSNDVDLWVTGPDGTSIGWSNERHSHGAYLDFDDTEGYGPEHYIIPDGHTMPYGQYHVDVNYYDDAGEGPANYTVTVEVGVIKDGVPYYDTTQTVSGTVISTDDRDNGVASFKLVDPSTVDKELPTGAQDE
ncbi:MAG TPA: hypothetical protein VEQ58_12230, partial [Polyangiaceae bacterium]|nr:hypothetical protein [Polyangiaceae bacterium]